LRLSIANATDVKRDAIELAGNCGEARFGRAGMGDRVALFARGLECDAGKGAKRHISALAAETVPEQPHLGPIGPNHDAEAFAVGNRVFLVRWRRIADFRVAQFIDGKASSQSGGQPGRARTVANRTGRQYMKKRMILRGFLLIGERARIRKNRAGKANGAQGGIEFSIIRLKLGHFSNDEFPVYPSM